MLPEITLLSLMTRAAVSRRGRFGVCAPCRDQGAAREWARYFNWRVGSGSGISCKRAKVPISAGLRPFQIVLNSRRLRLPFFVAANRQDPLLCRQASQRLEPENALV